MDAAMDWIWKELPRNGHIPDAAPSAEEDQARMDAAVDEAYRRGLDEGMARGRAQARQEVSSAVTVANRVVDDMRAAHAEWLENLEEALAALSVGIARHLVEGELEADPALVARLVGQAMSHFPTGQSVRIRLNPGDLKVLAEGVEGTDAVAEGRDARWIADASVSPGSFVMEGPERVLDGRLDRALERIYRSLTDG